MVLVLLYYIFDPKKLHDGLIINFQYNPQFITLSLQTLLSRDIYRLVTFCGRINNKIVNQPFLSFVNIRILLICHYRQAQSYLL